ncbi:MAG: DUF3011 domain-containing protein [Burkholderiales bacterium]|nr:DUF3011 domain-containing protein [Burkholderiales bacterium]
MKLTSRISARAVLLATAAAMATPAFADYTIRCGSVGGGHNTCRLSRPGYVTIERKISGARCDQGRTWDFDRREIWVDRGCEADFRVETHDHRDGDNKDKAIAGVILGAAILGALASNKEHRDDEQYRDENYYGSRHSSYIPRWMVGTFRGYNPQYGAEVEMRISEDGRVVAETQGQTLRGWINNQKLQIGGAVFSIDQTREGFVTAQRGDRFNEVRYRRMR